MGDRERTGGSGTRWCAGSTRAMVHQVAVVNVPANEQVPGVSGDAGYSTHESSSPGALKAGVQIVRTIPTTSTACKGNRFSWVLVRRKGYNAPSVRADGSGVTTRRVPD